MAPKKQVPTGKSTAIVPWDQKFASAAREAKAQVKNVGSGVNVRFGRGSITVGGVDVPGGKLPCVIVGSCALNAWYEGLYDPNDIQPPVCYAFAEVVGDEEMAPHEKAAKPQNDLCATCEKNQFGTAETGRGKACGNNVRLGLLTAKDVADADLIPTAELVTAKVSTTNVKNFAGYVKMLADEYNRPPWAVVTEISSHDDKNTQIRLEFKMVELIDDDDTLAALEKRTEPVQEVLQTPFAPAAERPAKQSNVGRGSKFASKGVRR